MNDGVKQDWSNYWQGRSAAKSGDALAGVGIETDSDIADFWDKALKSVTPNAKVLDLACGAGSALRRAHAVGLSDLHGVDISKSALGVLKEALPEAKTYCAHADDTRLDPDSFDVVISQFGVEYAGLYDAGQEVVRVLASGGQFFAIIHMQGGAIASEVAQNEAMLADIKATNFIPLAKDVFHTLFRLETNGRSHDPEGRFARVSAAFAPAQETLRDLAKQHKGIAAHLYAGTQSLYQRRKSYSLEDINGWLDRNGAEIDAYHGRMKSMLTAAQSEDEMKRFCTNFPGSAKYEILKLGPDSRDAAWTVQAKKN